METIQKFNRSYMSIIYYLCAVLQIDKEYFRKTFINTARSFFVSKLHLRNIKHKWNGTNPKQTHATRWTIYMYAFYVLCVSEASATELSAMLFLLFARLSSNSPWSFQRFRRTLRQNFNWIWQQMKLDPLSDLNEIWHQK